MRVLLPRMTRAAVAVAALAACVALWSPAMGRADCGGIYTAQAAHHAKGRLPPLAVGDSTMILSLPGLSALGYNVNAQGCRQFFQGVDLLSALHAQGLLPEMVAIALGANGAVTATDIAAALHVLGPRRLLVLVTPRQLGGSAGPNAAEEHAAARAHPHRIKLLDWVADSAGHSSWFGPDGLHLTFAGVAGFNALLARALPYAYTRR